MRHSIKNYEETLEKINYIIEQSNDYTLILAQICKEISDIYNLEINIKNKEKVYFDNTKEKKKLSMVFKICCKSKAEVIVSFLNDSGEFEFDSIFSNSIEVILGLVIKNIVVMEILEEEKKLEEVKNVIDKLSFSELTAVIKIFSDYDKSNGTIVASQIAQMHNLTRSSIVNAIRKLESAMVIESYSLGVKGTHIKVINNYFIKEINKLK